MIKEDNVLLKNIRSSAGLRLAVFFGSFFVLLLLSSFIGMMINQLSGDVRSHTLWGSVVQCILAFCLPAFILAKFSSNNWSEWLALTKAPSMKSILGVLIVYCLSMPAMEWLIEWNASLHLPESMSGLETTLRSWEEASESISKVLLEAHGFLAVLAGVLVIGILTGFSEEMFFRGGLQGIFVRTNIGPSTAVWIAAFVFSFMHFQFFGFLPRLLMGAFFGYLLIWTRSLWVPVFAHALNNSTVVIASSITGEATMGMLDNGSNSLLLGNSLSVIGSVVLTALYLIFCRDWVFKNAQSRKNQPWQKRQLPPVSER